MVISSVRLSFGVSSTKNSVNPKDNDIEGEKIANSINTTVKPSLDNLKAYYTPSFGGFLSILGIGTDAKVEKIIDDIVISINEKKVNALTLDHQDNQCEIGFNLDDKQYVIEHDNSLEPSFGPVPAVVNQNRACITIIHSDDKEEIHFIDGKQWNKILDAAHLHTIEE
ncbi:MAG: hypothetical protein AB7V50_09990 [Vampirovibrionia bacterium]